MTSDSCYQPLERQYRVSYLSGVVAELRIGAPRLPLVGSSSARPKGSALGATGKCEPTSLSPTPPSLAEPTLLYLPLFPCCTLLLLGGFRGVMLGCGLQPVSLPERGPVSMISSLVLMANILSTNDEMIEKVPLSMAWDVTLSLLSSAFVCLPPRLHPGRQWG